MSFDLFVERPRVTIPRILRSLLFLKPLMQFRGHDARLIFVQPILLQTSMTRLCIGSGRLIADHAGCSVRSCERFSGKPAKCPYTGVATTRPSPTLQGTVLSEASRFKSQHFRNAAQPTCAREWPTSWTITWSHAAAAAAEVFRP